MKKLAIIMLIGAMCGCISIKPDLSFKFDKKEKEATVKIGLKIKLKEANEESP